MILYTIVPLEVIFMNEDKDNRNTYIEIDYMGVKIQAIPLSGNQYMINRIISTSPRAYLDPKLKPGSIVKL